MRLMTEVDMRALDKAIKIAPKVLMFELGDDMDRITKGFLKRFRQQRLQGPPGVRGASGYGLWAFRHIQKSIACIPYHRRYGHAGLYGIEDCQAS